MSNTTVYYSAREHSGCAASVFASANALEWNTPPLPKFDCQLHSLRLC